VVTIVVSALAGVEETKVVACRGRAKQHQGSTDVQLADWVVAVAGCMMHWAGLMV
jgi:hypothetical protein